METATSSTYTIPSQTNIGDFAYSQYCVYRLPCGVCTRTNSICPLSGNTITPSWQYPNVVYCGTTTDKLTIDADSLRSGPITTDNIDMRTMGDIIH